MFNSFDDVERLGQILQCHDPSASRGRGPS
jgi:hypothetical protein